MEPTLTAGDRVLGRRARVRSVSTGQIAIVESPTPGTGGKRTGEPPRHSLGRRWMIKRVAAIPGEPAPDGMPDADAAYVPEGCLIVLGDSAEMSMDSRYLGYIPGERLLGIVVASLPRRAGSTDDQMQNDLLSRPQEPSAT
jgi:signal peptidase I